jgi:hypothetical protein
MLERAILELLDPVQQELATQALVSLSLTGVWSLQEQLLIERLAQGFHEQEDAELLKKIRVTQEFIKVCRAMQGLGDELKKERTNA